MRLDKMHKLFNKTLKSALAGKNLSDDDIEEAKRGITRAIPDIVQKIADTLYKSLNKNTSLMLNERREYRHDFELKHYELWEKGLDLLEAYLVVAFEAGDNFNNHYSKTALAKKDYMFKVLTSLHARAVHVGFEVLTLLRSGYADGAHARWRTAHEIGVVSNFISMHNPEVAKRYLEHEAIESYKALIGFQEHALKLGYKPYSDGYVKKVRVYCDNLCERYGKSFRTDYGWAAEALNTDKPKFRDIENASGLNHLRPYYKMASHNVHANPKGLTCRLGLSNNSRLLLAGPSNYGLTDPAHGVSISILQATTPLLHSKPTIDSVVIGTVMHKYVDDIGKAFIKIHQRMKKET